MCVWVCAVKIVVWWRALVTITLRKRPSPHIHIYLNSLALYVCYLEAELLQQRQALELAAQERGQITPQQVVAGVKRAQLWFDFLVGVVCVFVYELTQL